MKTEAEKAGYWKPATTRGNTVYLKNLTHFQAQNPPSPNEEIEAVSR